MSIRNPGSALAFVERMQPTHNWPAEPPVDQVLATRASRPVSLPDENLALCHLAQALARSDSDVLQQLVQQAMKLCGAHSAGVSLVELDGAETVFRWLAVAGRWTGYRMGSMPRNASPCGVVLDRRAPQVMRNPALYFPALRNTVPLATEALLVPFEALGETVGTLWVVSHDEMCFCAEDLRIMRSLAPFAAAAYVSQVMLRRAFEDRDELLRTADRLRRENARLWGMQKEKGP